MPAIMFSFKDLKHLVGKDLTIEQLEEYGHLAKADIESYDKETDEIKMEFQDTNLPYLWSVEGFCRFLKGALGKTKGLQKIEINKSEHDLIVEKDLTHIRPYISCFTAKGQKLNDYLLKQIIQLQEKFCETYGRKRKKVSIGLYSYKKIKFPVHYKAADPKKVEFVPLEFKSKMNLKEILSEHPKGKEYSYVLEGMDKYPVLMDSNDEVLSFIPIINSNMTGRLEVNDEDIFFEATGTDERAVNLAAVIFAYALSDRGFKIHSVNVQKNTKKVEMPILKDEKIDINEEQIERLLGMKLKENDIKDLIERSGYGFNHFKVSVPPYREDILHQRDVIEDLGIMFGFNNIEDRPLSSFTVGSMLDFNRFVEKVRVILVGLGYQELISAILSNKHLMLDKMGLKDENIIEIQDYMSETYSIVRNWNLPIIMDVFSKNKHSQYPQKIFEEGIVNKKKHDMIDEHNTIAVATSHEKADYTEIRQVIEYLMDRLGVKYDIDEGVHDSFIDGRSAVLKVKGKKIAVLGEVHPKVLTNFNLELPVAAMELNLTELYDMINK